MIDYREFKNRLFILSRSEITYEMRSGDNVWRFTLLPRTVARLEAALAVLSEDARRRRELEEMDLSKVDIDKIDIPEPEYKVRWNIFKIITSGPHEAVEAAGLEEHLDLDLVDEAISDFFGLSSRLERKYSLMSTSS